MKTIISFPAGAAALAVLLLPVTIQAAEKKAPKVPLFAWNAFWTGSWEHEENLFNRTGSRLKYNPLGLSFRLEAADKRPADGGQPGFQALPENPFGPESGAGPTNFGGGLYHGPTGSRLLYGVPDEWGLPARLRNPWIRGLPFPDRHRPLMADLKAEPGSAKPEAYLYLGSPALGPLRLFGSAQARFNEDGIAGGALGSGAEISLPPRAGRHDGGVLHKALTPFYPSQLRLEGFYAGRVLPEKEASAWFSMEPSLPERESRLYGMGFLYASPLAVLSSDIAASETFAFGRDLYGNVGLKFGRTGPKALLPWSYSLAVDAGGERYIGSNGAHPGAALRLGDQFEWPLRGGGLFRLSGSLRSPGVGKDFERSESGVYYRLGLVSAKKHAPPALRLSRVSLNGSRNGSDRKKVLDKVDTQAALRLSFPAPAVPAGEKKASRLKTALHSPLSFSFTGSLEGLAKPGEYFSALPLAAEGWDFNSAHLGAEIYWPPGPFQLRTRLGWGIKSAGKNRDELDDTWDLSFSTAFRMKYGRLSVKIASSDFPEKWDYTLSWRVEKK